MKIQVEAAREADQELVDALGRLLPQLSRSARPLDAPALARDLACDTNTVLVARADHGIVGTLTLTTVPLPSGLRARVEDVIVDEAARGHGIAGLLMEQALQSAREAGARTVDLTSRPDREAANRLYERLGFQRRGSTVYRYPIEG
ncbi:GNAT family N-acetyltransferase [Streptomyces panaciradicis]|uniref:GNAT family N-acetyltransferase n=1 Tax=Streptomyces panaciradicis TaxID=1470261 RepID=UPI00201CCA78|nr:GNAT family N-acetyltransferase [Streptomyces panaciradicis]MCL6674265.1 GNAT family N-acetyltransferase [Streptomyces panaciradicis]